MQVHDKLAELGAMVEDARAMPMSASCILNRGEVLALLDEIQRALPEDLARAEKLLADRDTVIDIGRQEAERLVERGRQEQQRLVSETEVAKEADEEEREQHDEHRERKRPAQCSNRTSPRWRLRGGAFSRGGRSR